MEFILGKVEFCWFLELGYVLAPRVWQKVQRTVLDYIRANTIHYYNQPIWPKVNTWCHGLKNKVTLSPVL